MPRAKRQTAEVEDTEDTQPTTARRGRRAKAAPEPEPEAAPAKRGRKPKDPDAPAEPWKDVDVEDTDKIVVGEKPPRGKHQVALVEFIESRGRKATTAAMLYDELEQDEVPKAYSDYIIKNSIHRDVMALAD